MIWHSKDVNSVLAELKTDPQRGLDGDEARARLEIYGKNSALNRKDSAMVSLARCIFTATSVPLLILSFCWIVIASIWRIGGYAVPVVMAISVFVRGVVLYLFKLYTPKKILSECGEQHLLADVTRDGEHQSVPAECLVPGDIVTLRRGDIVPADCRLITSNALHCDEKILHDDRFRVEKDAAASDIPEIAPIYERRNMLYSGSVVLEGEALAVVTDTGAATESARHTTDNGKDSSGFSVYKNTLQRRRIAILAETTLCVILLIAGIVRGLIIRDSFWVNLLYWLTVTACFAFAFTPESTRFTGDILTAFKLAEMRKNKISLNNRQVLEKLNNVNVICCDKTGSITRSGKIELQEVYDGKTVDKAGELGESALRVLQLAALCCDKTAESAGGHKDGKGDATQIAIISGALKALKVTAEELDVSYPRMCEIPFDRQKKTMVTVNMINGKPIAIVRGAPENILPLCPHAANDEINAVKSAMASRALRVIAVAFRPVDEVPSHPSYDDLAVNLQFAGLLGLYNPPRHDAANAVTVCRQLGIRPVMLTGDEPENAAAYAKNLKILTDDNQLITECELAKLSDEQLAENINDYSVFAGIGYENKTRVVRALQSAGNTVLMTGDAMEDIDALRAADVGCTPKGIGTDVARATCDMSVSGGLFAIVSAVSHARCLFHNIYALTGIFEALCISALILGICSVFTGNLFAFAPLIIAGTVAAFLLPLFVGVGKTSKFFDSNKAAGYGGKGLFISACVLPVAAVGAGFLPGDMCVLQLATLLLATLFLTYRVNVRRFYKSEFKFDVFYILPVFALFAVMILFGFIPAAGFSVLPAKSWVLMFIISLIPAAVYV